MFSVVPSLASTRRLIPVAALLFAAPLVVLPAMAQDQTGAPPVSSVPETSSPGTAAPAPNSGEAPAPIDQGPQTGQASPAGEAPPATEPPPATAVGPADNPDVTPETAPAPGTTADFDGAFDDAVGLPELAEDASEAAVLPHDLSPMGMFMAADIVVKAVMIGLAIASLVTWTIALAKSLELLGAARRARRGRAWLARATSLESAAAGYKLRRGADVVGSLCRAAMEEIRLSPTLEPDGIKERIGSRLERIEVAAGRRIASGTAILATIGSTAPFVGLFGTVWGIMNAFIGISQAQTTNLAVVAPGIAEALLATALGLVAAIPAVVIYNMLARWTGSYRAVLRDASAEILRHVSRDLERHGPALRRAAE